MQSLTPAGESNPNGHTQSEILAALQGLSGIRRLTFRYDRLDEENTYLGPLSSVVDGHVEQNWLADIKRKASFTIRDDGVLNYLSDRIQPWVRLGIPPYGRNDWVEWPQGVFLLTTPTRTVDSSGRVLRQVDGYDALTVYADDLVSSRYTLLAGSVVTDEVATLLDTAHLTVQASALTLSTDREWEPGTSKLKIISDLLDSINYESLSMDEYGRAVVQAYRSPTDRPAEYTYADDDQGLIVPQVDQTLDLFSVANHWILTVSNPDQDPLSSTYTNTDPASPTSTVRRGRTITDFRQELDAADQTTLDDKVARLAFAASQVYEIVTFSTALMPVHSGNDVIAFRYGGLAINDKYSEHSWSMDLQAGASMSHTIRRVVSV